MNKATRIVRRIARPAPTAPAPAPVSPPKRTIPIKQAPTPHTDEDRGPKVDHAAIVAKYKAKVSNRKSAIRAHCIECCCGVVSEVAKCTVEKCALFPFRMGADPFNKKTAEKLARQDGEEESE